MTNDNERDKAPRQKRAYQKPALIQVALKPDEAVLGSCKTASSAGPGGANSCQAFGTCSSLGS